MPRSPKIAADLQPDCKSQVRAPILVLQAQTELNPTVQQQAAFDFSPLSDDFPALSLRCNRKRQLQALPKASNPAQDKKAQEKKYARFEADEPANDAVCCSPDENTGCDPAN